MRPVTWISDIAFENTATIDGRFIGKDAIGWRELPLTLMAMTVNSGEGGHAGSYVAGRIDAVSRDTHKDMSGKRLVKGAAAIRGQGAFDTGGENGSEIARLVEDETVRGISVDLAVNEYGFRDPETGDITMPDDMTDEQWDQAYFGNMQLAITDATMVAATVCPTPAFDGARIAVQASAGADRIVTVTSTFTLVESDALVAAAAPLNPPMAWFTHPEADRPTPLTITDDGQVYGHIALWDACHTGLAEVCTRPPHSMSGYAYFHVGEIETFEGECVAVGKLMYAGKHAPLNLTRGGASKHYDDHTYVGAYVRAMDGKHGIWVAGALRHGIDELDVQQIRANPPSGDWRGVNGSLELIAALAVPVPGYPIPRAQAALAASGDELEITGLVVTSGEITEEADEGAALRRIEILVAAAADNPVEALAALAET